MLRRGIMRLASSDAVLAAFCPVRNKLFNPTVRSYLEAATAARGFKSRYWVTPANAHAVFGVGIKPGETPTKAANLDCKICELSDLMSNDATTLLNQCGNLHEASGVFLLNKGNWRRIRDPSVVRQLTQHSDQSLSLWVTESEVQHLGLRHHEGFKGYIEVTESFQEYYNADQTTVPKAIQPLTGVAIMVNNGKRFPQPLHDVLVISGLSRGFASPFWGSKTTMRDFCGSPIKDGEEPIVLPLQTAVLLSVSDLRYGDVFLDVRKPPEKREGSDEVQWHLQGRWITSAAGKVVEAIRKTAPNVDKWVSKDDYLRFIAEHFSKALGDEIRNVSADCATPVARVDLAHFTKTSLYNADQCESSKKVLSRTTLRLIHAGTGKAMKLVDQEQLPRTVQKYASPFWCFADKDSKKRKIRGKKWTIRKGEKPIVLNCKETLKVLYNVDDIENVDSLLTMYPPPKHRKDFHAVFNAKWVSLHNAMFKSKLKNRPVANLQWISARDVDLQRLTLKPGAEPLELGQKASVIELYNSEQMEHPELVVAEAKLIP